VARCTAVNTTREAKFIPNAAKTRHLISSVCSPPLHMPFVPTRNCFSDAFRLCRGDAVSLRDRWVPVSNSYASLGA